MKYKIAGAAVMMAVLLLSMLVPLWGKERSGRIHQHILNEEKQPCANMAEEEFCTHLPLVMIDTGGIEIPGKISGENAADSGDGTYYTRAADGEKTIAAQMKVIDNRGLQNHMEDAAALSSKIRIRVRGNSSRRFDKSNYAIRLIQEDGTNNPQEMMGMDAHHEWVLHGPYLDKTLIRNYFCYNLAGEIMDYAPNVRFCEVILNGTYIGVYVMTESITAGKEGARLQLDVNKSRQTYTGYILRLDSWPEEPADELNNFTMYTMRTKQMMEIVYPGKAKLTAEMKRSIRDDFSAFEKALYSYDYDTKKYGYENDIDVESFVDYFLINELTYNRDAGSKSTYIYKMPDYRFRMCVWDFNNAFDNFQEGEMGYRGFFMQDCVWYTMLLKDEDFTKRIVERYRMLRESWFDEEYLMKYIDDTLAYLGDAVARNFEVWGYSFTDKIGVYISDGRNIGSHEEAVLQLKTWLHRRLQWMDENIESLYQYSAESAVKKYNENAE